MAQGSTSTTSSTLTTKSHPNDPGRHGQWSTCTFTQLPLPRSTWSDPAPSRAPRLSWNSTASLPPAHVTSGIPVVLQLHPPPWVLHPKPCVCSHPIRNSPLPTHLLFIVSPLLPLDENTSVLLAPYPQCLEQSRHPVNIYQIILYSTHQTFVGNAFILIIFLTSILEQCYQGSDQKDTAKILLPRPSAFRSIPSGFFQ